MLHSPRPQYGSIKQHQLLPKHTVVGGCCSHKRKQPCMPHDHLKATVKPTHHGPQVWLLMGCPAATFCFAPFACWSEAAACTASCAAMSDSSSVIERPGTEPAVWRLHPAQAAPFVAWQQLHLLLLPPLLALLLLLHVLMYVAVPLQLGRRALNVWLCGLHQHQSCAAWPSLLHASWRHMQPYPLHSALCPDLPMDEAVKAEQTAARKHRLVLVLWNWMSEQQQSLSTFGKQCGTRHGCHAVVHQRAAAPHPLHN